LIRLHKPSVRAAPLAPCVRNSPGVGFFFCIALPRRSCGPTNVPPPPCALKPRLSVGLASRAAPRQGRAKRVIHPHRQRPKNTSPGRCFCVPVPFFPTWFAAATIVVGAVRPFVCRPPAMGPSSEVFRCPRSPGFSHPARCTLTPRTLRPPASKPVFFDHRGSGPAVSFGPRHETCAPPVAVGPRPRRPSEIQWNRPVTNRNRPLHFPLMSDVREVCGPIPRNNG